MVKLQDMTLKKYGSSWVFVIEAPFVNKKLLSPDKRYNVTIEDVGNGIVSRDHVLYDFIGVDCEV